MRKTYNGEFKKKVVLEALKEEKTISQIATENEIDSRQIFRWKNIALEKLSDILENGNKKGDEELIAVNKKLEESYAEIGRLTTQLNWLKKKCGIKLE